MVTETESLLLKRIDALTSAICLLAQAHGTRLSREQLAFRWGVHRNTIAKRIRAKDFPQVGPDGKWALSDVIAWEQCSHFQ